jgi:glycosyltransferase involved in cell wall biosynthesis
MTADAVGGVLTYALELVEGLAEHDVEVVLAVSGPAPTAADRRRLRAAPLAGYHRRELALEWMENPAQDLERSRVWLRELADATAADVLHLNSYAAAALPVDVPKLVVGHSCVLSWHEAVRRRPAGPDWRAYAARVRRGLGGADVLVAPTRALLGELVRLYRPACPCEVIPNGIADPFAESRPKEPFVLAAGRAWDEAKNLKALERVAGLLPWPALVAGAGGSLGRVAHERLRELYARAAVFAAPARYEPFGLAALEAGLARCALVLGDVPSLREVWGAAALYVDPFDDDDVARGLQRLIADESLRNRLAAAARRRALRYSRERMAGAYLDLYERLIAAAVAPTREVA